MTKRLLLIIIGIVATAGIAAAAVFIPQAMKAAPAAPVKTAEPAAYADGGSLDVAIQVEVQADGFPSGRQFMLQLEAEDGAPLPEGAEGGSFQLVLSQPGRASFPPITFTALGSYYYHVRQIPGNLAGATYDGAVYDIHIQVLSDPDTGEWYAMVSIRPQGGGEKTDVCLFVNAFSNRTGSPTATPTATAAPKEPDPVLINHVGDCFE